MNLIKFKNLPDTSTPLNAENLNNNFEELEKQQVYSEEETKIGTWINNKPIYRKVVPLTSIGPGNTAYDVSTGILNVENMVKMECMILYGTNEWKNLPWLYVTSGGNINAAYAGGITFKINTGVLTFQVGTSLANITKGFVIMQYTKTTD